jgi:hypothetical protein
MNYKTFLLITMLGITSITINAMAPNHSGGAPDSPAAPAVPGINLSSQKKAALVGALVVPAGIGIVSLAINPSNEYLKMLANLAKLGIVCGAGKLALELASRVR